MSKERKLKLRELGINQLLTKYTIAVRKTWELACEQTTEIAVKSHEYREELRIKMELKHRLTYKSVKGATQAKVLETGDKFLFLEDPGEDAAIVYLFQGRSEGGEVFACALARGGQVSFHPDHYVFKLRM